VLPGAVRRQLDHAEDHRVQAIGLAGQLGMPTVHRQGVLGQVVGADREEVAFRRQDVGLDGGRRHFHHDADLDAGSGAGLAGGSGLFFRQDALGGAQFLQRRDHREHDVQVGQGSRAQDGAKLGAEHRRLVEADPDAAQAEEGVFLFRERQVGQRLVAADIQGADDQRTAAAEHFGDGAVGSGLLVLAGSLIALVEQELGAQQSYALATGGDGRQGVVGVADIGDDFDPVAVAGLGRLHRGRQFLPAALGASGDLFAGPGDFRLVRIATEHATSAVEQDLGAVVEVEDRFVDAADRGNAERAGDDRDVAGGAAAGGAEAQDAGPVD
jgi:hypothetical protein